MQVNVNALQREKFAQLIALIGKREFPEQHSQYVTQILSLTKVKFVLGITLLKSTSYEQNSTKLDCSHQQKTKFIQRYVLSLSLLTYCIKISLFSMVLYLGDIISLLGKFLTLCTCHVNSHELVVGNDIDFDMHSSLPNDEKFVFCCTELLSTISSMFQWMPSNIDNILSAEFFNNIYELCTYSNEKYLNINLASLTTICELFYLQKLLPQIQVQANGITELIHQKYLMESSEEYQDKLTELLKLFIQQQWAKFMNQPEFSSKEFLLHLFSFTFTESASALTFAERLSLWIPIIKSFDQKTGPRYTETVIQLISNIIVKMQFERNYELLELLDSEELDENMETELQSFRNNCIEVILSAAEMEPFKIFDLLNHELNKDNGNLKNYVTLLSTLPDYSKEVAVKTNQNNHFRVGDIVRYSSDPTFHLHCMCRDLTCLLQAVTQTTNVVLTLTEERNNSILNVIKTCILTLKLSNQKKLHLYNFDSTTRNNLIELQAQLMSSVRSLMLMRTEIYENHNEIFQLINSTLENVLPSHYGLVEPHLVLNAATQLLITISGIIRPNYFLKNPLVEQLLHSDLLRFDPQIRLQIKRIIFNALILPFNAIAVNHTEGQEYEKRREILQQYVAFISFKFLSMVVSVEHHVTEREQMRLELKDYENLLNTYEDTNNYTKQILLNAMNPIIKKSIEIFQFTAKQQNFIYDEQDISTIIDFNLSVVRCLQVQVGSDFVIQIVRLFLEIASLPNRSSQALNKLLEMLIFIVQHAGVTSTQLMPDILKLTIDNLLGAQVDIAFNIFTLFDSMLQCHWNYFQKTHHSGVTRNNQEDLMKILTAYGQFLCSGSPIDPNCCRVILTSLESLNEKCRLYDKAFFKSTLLKSFLATLLQLIVSSDGILFYDQIISIVFHMSEKNKPALHECMTNVFQDGPKVTEICAICNDDLPTFANAMEILIRDTQIAQS